MPTLTILSGADEELKEVSQFYEGRCGMGAAFMDEMALAYQKIRQNPLSWPRIKGGFRKYKLHRFPYNVVYKIVDEEIFVFAVAHQHQKPFYWRNRV